MRLIKCCPVYLVAIRWCRVTLLNVLGQSGMTAVRPQIDPTINGSYADRTSAFIEKGFAVKYGPELAIPQLTILLTYIGVSQTISNRLFNQELLNSNNDWLL